MQENTLIYYIPIEVPKREREKMHISQEKFRQHIIYSIPFECLKAFLFHPNVKQGFMYHLYC